MNMRGRIGMLGCRITVHLTLMFKVWIKEIEVKSPKLKVLIIPL